MLEIQAMPVRFRLQEILDSREPPLSQRALARCSGISLVTVNAIANNRTTRVDLETIDKLAAVLGVAPGELIVRKQAKKETRGRR